MTGRNQGTGNRTSESDDRRFREEQTNSGQRRQRRNQYRDEFDQDDLGNFGNDIDQGTSGTDYYGGQQAYGGQQTGYGGSSREEQPGGDWSRGFSSGGRWGGQSREEEPYRHSMRSRSSGTGGQGRRPTLGQFAGKGPKGYRRSDERITEEVNEQLTQHGDLDASEVEVRVQDGEVTLTGNVDSRESKRLAEDVAENVSGVKEVINQIRIRREQNWGGLTDQDCTQTGESASKGTRSSGANRS